jgi:hypothetical protein
MWGVICASRKFKDPIISIIKRFGIRKHSSCCIGLSINLICGCDSKVNVRLIKYTEEDELRIKYSVLKDIVKGEVLYASVDDKLLNSFSGYNNQFSLEHDECRISVDKRVQNNLGIFCSKLMNISLKSEKSVKFEVLWTQKEKTDRNCIKSVCKKLSNLEKSCISVNVCFILFFKIFSLEHDYL